jgi:hypothetical protein
LMFVHNFMYSAEVDAVKFEFSHFKHSH